MVPHGLKKIQVKLATVFEVPRKKNYKVSKCTCFIGWGFYFILSFGNFSWFW